MEEIAWRRLQAQHGAIALRELIAMGYSSSDVQTWVRQGSLIRVRRGAFVSTEAWGAAATPEARLALRGSAILRGLSASTALSHHAAAAVWGLPTYGVDDVVDVVAPRGKRRDQIRWHQLPPEPLRSSEFLGGNEARRVSVAQCIVGIARQSGMEAGLVTADAALHLGRTTVRDIDLAIRATPRPGAAARLPWAMDGKAESVGETRTRLILTLAGLPVASQVPVRDGAKLFARPDLWVRGSNVVIEFDGLIKYAGPIGRANWAAERARHRRLEDLGLQVLRLEWRDLSRPTDVVRRVWDLLATASSTPSCLVLP